MMMVEQNIGAKIGVMKQSGPKTGDQDHENHTKTAAKGPKSLRKVLLAIITFSISSDYIGRTTEHRTDFFLDAEHILVKQTSNECCLNYFEL